MTKHHPPLKRRRRHGPPAFLFLLLAAVVLSFIWPASAPEDLQPFVVAIEPEPKPVAFNWPETHLYDKLPDTLFQQPAVRGEEYSEPPPPEVTAIMPAAGRVEIVPPNPNSRPRIAIVIDDVGPDLKGARRAIALPAPVTLAILPYAEKARSLAEKARAEGHQLLIHLPMEPDDVKHNNPGPDALLTSLAPGEIQQRLWRAFDSFDGYVGVNNHMGSRFTEDARAMKIVLGELAQRNLMFLDSRTTHRSAAPDLAASLNMNFAVRDVFLDNEIDVNDIMQQLRLTERFARRHGAAIAIGHPHSATLAALEAWIPEAKAAGFELVPVTALAYRAGVVPAAD